MKVSCYLENTLTVIHPAKKQKITRSSEKPFCIFAGNQSYCDGVVNVPEAKKIVEALSSDILHAIPKIQEVTFQEKKITATLEGGVCTVMALIFATKYFEIQNQKLKSLHFFHKLVALKEICKTATPFMRTRQAAFNTITVHFSEKADLTKAKIAALVRYHGLIVGHSSEETDIQSPDAKAKLETSIALLPYGIYLLRHLKPANNDKKEEYGHSMIYIKTAQDQLFYDPNIGLYSNVNNSHIYGSLTYYFRNKQTSLFRFYQLEKA